MKIKSSHDDRPTKTQAALEICQGAALAAADAVCGLAKLAAFAAVITAVAVPLVVIAPFCMHHGDVGYY
jgi:hypothetical protein